MNPTTRTLAFAAAAAVSVGVALATHWSYQPADPLANIPIGQPFYPDFTDPNEATGLRVASYDAQAGRTNVFSVEFKNGMWRIPSHHNYPADGEKRLAQTASSIIGVTRKAFVESSPAAYRRFKVLDPLDDSVGGTDGRGDRITLLKGDQPLVDIIVGEKLEGDEGTYYVRRADESAIYTADLGNLQLSTRFADWIEPDLLDVNRNDIRELVIDRYHIDEARGAVVQEETNVLHRDSATADWQLKGLDPEKEKLKTSEINSTLFALDDLRIVGVRPKPAGLSAELKTMEGMALTPLDLLDLQEKGFFVDQRQGRLLSNEGQVMVGTEQGVLYVLRFGEEFSGSDVEIEVGSKKEPPKSDAAADGEKSGGADDSSAEANAEQSSGDADEPSGASSADKGENADDASPSDSNVRKSRYLFITAQFDEELVGPKPSPPTKPEPPTPQPEGDSEKKDGDASNTGDGAAQPEAAEPSEKKNADAAAKPDPQKEYEEALQEYQKQQEEYEIKLKDYERKLEEGKKKVNELNSRFADWYYVVSADVFDRIRLKRDAIVEPVEMEPDQSKAPAASESPPAELTPPAAPQPEPAESPDAAGNQPQEKPQPAAAQTPASDSGSAENSPGTQESAEGKRPAAPADAPSNPAPDASAPKSDSDTDDNDSDS